MAKQLSDTRPSFDSNGEVHPHLKVQDVKGSPNSSQRLQGSLCIYSPEELITATNNFDSSFKIGKGGQATVYRAVLRGRNVAIKKFEEINVSDLISEAEYVRRLRHPNILLLMGFCEELNCIVSELMIGGSLQDRLNPSSRHRFPPLSCADRLRIAHEVTVAVHYLHTSNICHKDLKPANILLDQNNKARVCDLGLSRDGTEPYKASGLRGSIG